MKTALFTVAYAQAQPFFADFFASVAAQDEDHFDLLILNDGTDPRLLAGIPSCTVREASGSAAALRRQGIEWMRAAEYDAVVFADIDDRFDANRVSLSRQLLRQSEIVVNELTLFGESVLSAIQMLGMRLKEGQIIGEENLRRSNCMGMSNTAARIASIAGAAQEVPDSILAYDWNLYARAVIGGVRPVFTAATRTEYRQYGANIAGIFDQSDAQILRGVGVKADHYAQLSGSNGWYAEHAAEYEQLRKSLQANPAALHEYSAKIQAAAPLHPLWWESIRLEKEL